MRAVKEKISNMGSSVKEHLDIGKAQVGEKLEKATARTEEEKKLAHERKKAKEAEAKMELHQDKARHVEEKLRPKQPQYLHGYGYDHEPKAATTAETSVPPPYHLTGHSPPRGHKKY